MVGYWLRGRLELAQEVEKLISLYLLVLPIGAVVAVVAASAVIGRRGGKELKCPDCGEVFKAPAMDEKLGGLGWTIPYTGRVACPKCGARRSRRDYERVVE